MEKIRDLDIIQKLNVLKAQCKPTDTWEDNLENDDLYEELYTSEGLSDISTALDQFIDTYIARDDFQNGEEIIDVVKVLVIQLNELNEKHNDIIETVERDQLYGFIEATLGVMGFEYDGDITEEWREW